MRQRFLDDVAANEEESRLPGSVSDTVAQPDGESSTAAGHLEESHQSEGVPDELSSPNQNETPPDEVHTGES